MGRISGAYRSSYDSCQLDKVVKVVEGVLAWKSSFVSGALDTRRIHGDSPAAYVWGTGRVDMSTTSPNIGKEVP